MATLNSPHTQVDPSALADIRGTMNTWLRQQVQTASASTSTPAVKQESTMTLEDSAILAVESALSNHGSLAELEAHLGELFQQCLKEYRRCFIPAPLRKRQYVGQAGLIMSPDQCLTTLLDLRRVRAFWRACDHAIRDQIADRNATPSLRIVYPACGPLAPLLLPLLSYYHRNQQQDMQALRVTLIDVQPGAVTSLQHLVEKLGLGACVDEIHCGDALDYRPQQPVDILLMEAMQHGFSREGHFAMVRHFAGYMAVTGVMLPERISLQAVITEGQAEFVEQWQTPTAASDSTPLLAKRDIRIPLGEILSVTRETLAQVSAQKIDDATSLIPCGEVDVPPLSKEIKHPLLLICSQMQIYRDEALAEYDSGITHPLPDFQVCINFVPRDAREGDLLVRSGDRLKFYYCQNGLPGFLATVVNPQGSTASCAESVNG